MKKMITMFALVLLVNIVAKASPNITIRNNTSCTIYLTLTYSDDPNDPCIISGSSNLIAVTGSTTLYYDFGIVPAPGVPSGYGFYNGVKILNGSPGCANSGITIGNPCLYPSQLDYIDVLNNLCQACAPVMAKWNFSSPVPEVITLDLN